MPNANIFYDDTSTLTIGQVPVFVDGSYLQEAMKPIKKDKEKIYTAMQFLYEEWKYNKGIITGGQFQTIRDYFLDWRATQISKDFREGMSRAEKRVSLFTGYYTYSMMPDHDMYPISYCEEIRDGVWSLKIDNVDTMEGERISRRDVGNGVYMICDDTDGKITSDYKIIRFRDGEKYIHNWRDVDFIEWRGYNYERTFADSEGFIRCDCGEYIRRGQTCRCMNPEPDGYHSNTTPRYVLDSENAQYRVGLEIEKPARMSGENHIRMKKAGWRCETDSSVGYEYITPVLPLDDVKTTIDWIRKTGGRVVQNTIDSRCGGHIHVSVKDENTETTYKRILGWRPLLWALYPDRANYRYCNRKADRTDHSVDVGLRRGTVEIRIFPGLDSVRKLLFRLSLVKYILDNPQVTTQGAIEKILTDDDFRKILLIAYGKNTVRLGKFFERVQSFYAESGITGDMNDRIQGLSKQMVKDKQEGLSDTELERIGNLRTGE